MTLRNTILLRVALLICLFALALSATFYWIFTDNVRQRAQQAVDSSFALLEDSVQRKQREISREVEKVNLPLREAIDRTATVRLRHPASGPADRAAYLREALRGTRPLAGHLFALAEALGLEHLRMAIYDRQGALLMIFLTEAPLHYSVGLYLPELVPDRLLVQRRLLLQAGGSVAPVIQDEDQLLAQMAGDNPETIPLPPGQALSVPGAFVSGDPRSMFAVLDRAPALRFQIPIHGQPASGAYFAAGGGDRSQTRNSGLLELTLQVTDGEIQHVAALSGTQINLYVNGELACGTLPTYSRLRALPSRTVAYSDFISGPRTESVTPRIVRKQAFYESLMAVGNDGWPSATIAVLLSRDSERRATLIMLLGIGTAAVAFVLLAGVVAVRFSRQVAEPIGRMALAMQRLARGENVSGPEGTQGPDGHGLVEVRQMNEALDWLVRAATETATLAESIAAGNLQGQVTPRSAEDRMMHSLNAMVQQLNAHKLLTNQAIEEARVANLTLAEANRKLEALSSTDALTGIANRRRFDQTLANEYARHIRSGTELSLILLDVDFFKQFNDRYGHIQGDDCLRRIAAVLTEQTRRPYDLAARYGGEEFVCILPETGPEGAFRVAEDIRRLVMELAIAHEGSSVVACVTVSLGAVTARCRPERPPAFLLELADAYLYAAKNSGRNRTVAGQVDGSGDV